MPKSKKPAGGRAAKNFEPRYGEKTAYQDRKRRPGTSSAGKPGSKSPSHRGYRPETAESDAAPKRRWTAQERAGRDEARAIRTHARDDRPRRDDRPARDDRQRSGGYGRSSRDDRPRRDDRPSYGDRPRRDDRPS